jgi:hypothetical protein
MMFAHEPYGDDAPGAQLARLQEVIASEPMLVRRYERVVVAVNCREKMLVPERLYREEKLPLLWAFQGEVPPDDRFLIHPVEEWEALVASTLPGRARQVFEQLHPGCRFLPDGLPLARLALKTCENGREYLFADVHADYFDLLVVRDRQPLLLNAFRHDATSDILYFILNAARACRLDEEHARLYLTGNVSPRGKLHALLARYLPEPRVVTEPTLAALVQDPTFNTTPFVHLLNLHECAS